VTTRDDLKPQIIESFVLEFAGRHNSGPTFLDANLGEWNTYPFFSPRPTDLTTPLLQPAGLAKASRARSADDDGGAMFKAVRFAEEEV
jgi:hypothetical protein